MSRRYFNDWADADGSRYNFRGIFITQGVVCGKFKDLEEWNYNPLTIRLCLLQEAFKNLFDARLRIRQKTSNPGCRYHPTQTMHISGVASSLVVFASDYIDEPISLNLHEIYKNFYAFCSFFSAVLDRLAFETHILYGIGDPNKIDWRGFVKKDGTSGVLFQDLVNKNVDLSTLVLNNGFPRLLEIRNSFEHGKRLSISALSPDADFDFTIECENREDKVVEFALAQIKNLLNMCEEFYKKLIEN